jgi:hypothetical protein
MPQVASQLFLHHRFLGPQSHSMFKSLCLLGLFLFLASRIWGQGPPILLDKPIMLGANKGTIRPIFKIIDNAETDFNAFIIDADFNFSNNFALAVEIPFITPKDNLELNQNLGDMAIAAKYQFYRNDGRGKTTRIAAKYKGMFRTGQHYDTPILGMGHNMTYLGFLGAHESLRFGLQAEAGFLGSWETGHFNQWVYKLGFAIPLLKPTYPVNQINFYNEFEGNNFLDHAGKSQYGYYYAPGIQYAFRQFTFEASVQVPIKQQFHDLTQFERRRWTLFSMRFII